LDAPFKPDKLISFLFGSNFHFPVALSALSLSRIE
jgi:hypothetical protein